MSDYYTDRIRRLEADITQLNARLAAEREMQHERCHEKLRHAVQRMDELAAQRDRARDIAVALEQEIAACPAHQWHYPHQHTDLDPAALNDGWVTDGQV